MTIATKRIYDEASNGDGHRVLVDGMWPRGVRKADARLDDWRKDLAPSKALRQWFDHDPEKFDGFRRRYRDELKDREDALDELLDAAGGQTLTLLFAARDTEHNHAVVLRDVLAERAGQS